MFQARWDRPNRSAVFAIESGVASPFFCLQWRAGQPGPRAENRERGVSLPSCWPPLAPRSFKTASRRFPASFLAYGWRCGAIFHQASKGDGTGAPLCHGFPGSRPGPLRRLRRGRNQARYIDGSHRIPIVFGPATTARFTTQNGGAVGRLRAPGSGTKGFQKLPLCATFWSRFVVWGPSKRGMVGIKTASRSPDGAGSATIGWLGGNAWRIAVHFAILGDIGFCELIGKRRLAAPL
jgi:hypothetical protein